MAPSQTPTRRQPGPAVRVLRRVIAIIIVVAFSSAAAGGIIVLLVDIGSETTFQVVSTTALTGAFSVAAFCGATLLGRRGQWFGAVTIGLAAITLALSLWFLWGDPYADPFSTSFTDVLDQVLYSLIVVTAVASVCSLILLLASTRSWTVRIALALTLGLLALGTALTLITIWVETAWEYDWLTRVNGIVWILAALGVVVVPLSSLLLKTGSKPTAATQEGTAPHASATQSIASPGPSAASLHRLEAAARAEGITADELLDRLLETDGRPPSEPQT